MHFVKLTYNASLPMISSGSIVGVVAVVFIASAFLKGSGIAAELFCHLAGRSVPCIFLKAAFHYVRVCFAFFNTIGGAIIAVKRVVVVHVAVRIDIPIVDCIVEIARPQPTVLRSLSTYIPYVSFFFVSIKVGFLPFVN